MIDPNNSLYQLPARFRRMENLHIVFWLIKDLSWCMLWKVSGIIMIVPTLAIGIFITFRTRKIRSEFAHNLAIIFWICANSYWMIAEFFGFDEQHIWQSLEGRHLALIPFLSGVSILLYYYIILRPKEIRERKVVTL